MKYYFKENFHFLYGDGELYDENGDVAYTFKQTTVLYPEVHLYKGDREVGYVATEMRIILREYSLYMNGEKKETINPMFQLFRTHLMLMKSGWSVNGTFMSMKYDIKDRKGNIVAAVDQKFGFGSRYYIDILDEENEEFILLIMLIINLYCKGTTTTVSSQ